MKTNINFYPATDPKFTGSINYWRYLQNVESATFNEPATFSGINDLELSDTLDLTSGNQFVNINSKNFSSQYFTFYIYVSMMEEMAKTGINCKLMEFKREEVGNTVSVIVLRLVTDGSSGTISINYLGNSLSIEKSCKYIYIYI